MRITEQNTLLINLQDWQLAGLSYDQLRWQIRNNGVQATRACKGRPAEIVFDSIPQQYRSIITQKIGDPRQNAQHRTFRDLIVPDEKAVTYFTNYQLADGRMLSAAHIREYCVNANVLNAVSTMFKTQSVTRKALGGNMQGFWGNALRAVEMVRGELQHTLPANEIALKRKFQKYQEMGYDGIISGKFCNDNSRKVSDKLERLIMSLYIMPNKPFAADVQTLYKMFLDGEFLPTDTNTGEQFQPTDFIKNGVPLEISERTIFNYLNQPANRAIVDSKRSGAFNFNNEHRPHHHRTAPNFSFSKISMDDRDLPRKLTDGKRVKAYYAYDVTSGCVIGKAYSRNKDERLFIDCMQDMFRLIEREGFPMPLEAEVENHLVNKFFAELESMFPFFTICAPGNSQQKHAEHLNKAKKYSVEKKNHVGIGRWYLSESYRVDADKVNDEFVEKTYSFERLVEDDINDCFIFNNQLHPKQKKYPGLTRWQVLVKNLNPKAPAINKSLVYRGIGDHTKTSINRNQYVTVQNEKYSLPSPIILDRLLPGNYEVDAYYIKDLNGSIREVYLYQNNVFLCKCDPIVKYNTSKAETVLGQDDIAYKEQAKYVSQFDAKIKEGRNDLASITLIKTKDIKAAEAQQVKIVEHTPVPENSIEDMLKNYDPEQYRNRANEQI